MRIVKRLKRPGTHDGDTAVAGPRFSDQQLNYLVSQVAARLQALLSAPVAEPREQEAAEPPVEEGEELLVSEALTPFEEMVIQEVQRSLQDFEHRILALLPDLVQKAVKEVIEQEH